MKTKSTAWRVWLLASLLLVITVGCPQLPQKPGEVTPDERQPLKPEADITAAMRAARRAADSEYRERLLAIADQIEAGRIEYDTKLQLELSTAARETSRELQLQFGKALTVKGRIPDERRAEIADALRQIAEAYQ